MLTSKTNTPFIVKLAMTLISLMAIIYIAIMAREILVPLFFSLLAALLLLPVANFLENRLRLPRAGAAAISLLILIFILVTIFYLLGSQMATLVHDWPSLQNQFTSSLNDLYNWVAEHFHVDIQRQKDYIQNASSRIFASGPSVLASTLLSVSSVFLFLTLTVLFTFFMLLYRKLVIRFLITVFPKESSTIVYDIVENIQYIIRRYLIGLLVEMSIVAVLFCTSYLIFGVKYAVLFALMTALFNLVPYVGIFTAMAFSLFVTFAVAGGKAKILVIIITTVGVHLIDSNILLPFIVGSRIRINGMATILAVIAGEMIWGIPGMFLSVPFIAVTKIIFNRIEPLKPWGILLGHESKEEVVATQKPKDATFE
ncbi:MAG TPA: AI-2E family transporter [Niastella sp.]